ncbi:MAG: AsmA-like C-terminal region-containing protein, partial [Opitutales bacterium]
RVAAHGSLDLLSLVPEDVMSKLPAVIMNEAPYYNLSVEFDEGFALRNASLRARVDELEVAELKFDHIRLRGNYTEGVYSIDNLYLRRDWQWLNLGFGLDSSTKNYFLSLKGFAKPYDYNAILPRWWGGIFKDFDFEQIESGLGDFVIYGNTGNKAADFFFGHAKGSRVGYKGVLVDEGELFVRGRGAYAEVHKLNVRRGEGYARGDIRFASRLDNVRGPMSVRMDLDTKLPLSDAKKLFDQNIAKILDDFESDAMPRTVLRGAIYNSAYPEFDGLSYIDLTATCPFPLSYKGIPLKYLGFNLAGRTDITYLRDIRFGFAGGEAEAQADILTNGEDPAEVRFMASLKGANQEQTMGYLTTQGKKVEKVKQPEEDSPVSSTGRIDIMLHAKCPVQDFMKIAGSGDLQIENDKLYAIQLFGPLSRLLQNTRLGFTSFALNQLDAGFTIKDGTADINRLVINGPRTKIEAPGTVTLDNLSLDMRVSVYLFGNSGNPDSNIRKIGNLITKPIPNLLEFELTGYPEDQKWRSLYDPRKLIPRF